MYRKHRNSRKQMDSIPLVAEAISAKGYGAIETETADEESKPLLMTSV